MDHQYTFRFASLEHADRVYTAHHSTLDLDNTFPRRGRPLGYWAGFYMTYGDGLTQHSPESVVQMESFRDYLASLATHLLQNLADTQVVARNWETFDDALIDFALSVKFEGTQTKNAYRPQYYSTVFKRVTRSDKSNDKRWERVPDWADGSTESAFRLLVTSYMGGITLYTLYDSIRTRNNFDGAHPTVHFKLALEEYHPDLCASQAHECVAALVRSYRALDIARRQMDCFTHNMRNALEIAS